MNKIIIKKLSFYCKYNLNLKYESSKLFYNNCITHAIKFNETDRFSNNEFNNSDTGGVGFETNDKDKEHINYMYGSKAFEAMQLLGEDQIMEYLPLTSLDSDDEKDPEWIKDYIT